MRTVRRAIVAFFFLVYFGALTGAVVCNAQPQVSSSCDNPSSFVAVSPKTLQSHVLRTAEISSPLLATVAAHADILVRVFVDQNGSVKCARAHNRGNPFLRSLAEQAALKWKFRPLWRQKSRTPFQGDILFHINL